MYLAFQPRSLFDEYTFGDSAARSSLFKIQVGSTSYGSFSASDLKDYFEIRPGIGTFALYVTTDTVNGFVTSQASSNFGVSITNAAGGVLLDSVLFDPAVYQGGDSYTRVVSFQLTSDISAFIEINNSSLGTFSYGAYLRVLSDTYAPTVSSFGPADEATGVGVLGNIVLTFNEPIQRGTGDIVIKDTAGTVVETLNAATSGNLFISGNTLTIDPVSVLNFGTGYRVDFPAGGVKDIAGNAYAGTTTYNFTTASTQDNIPPVAPNLVTNGAFNFVIDPQVTLQSNMGTVVIELDPEHAPITVANMLAYVNSGFYDGTIFHRVIPNFMAQGGGYTGSVSGLITKTPNYSPITLESNNGLSNLRGTIAMARTNVADSATSQFFINQVDNAFLNYTSPTTQGYGYAVFGKVLSGMAVIDSIVQVPRTPVLDNSGNSLYPNVPNDVPLSNITITSVQQTEAGSSYSNAATFTVDALESGAQWSYSLDAGATWTTGVGTSFVVPVGSYAANAIRVRQTDAAGNLSATTGKFSSALVVETTAPTVAGFSPADEGTNVSVNRNIVITFTEAIAKGSGVILLKDAAGNLVESFEVAGSSRVALSGATLTIDPSNDLAYNTGYKIEIPVGAIRDLAGNAYAGFSAYNFTTGGANSPPSGTLTINGAASQGQTLSAASTLSDADGLGAIAYQWKADGTTIAGATSNTLVLTQALVGKAISVTASYTDGRGTPESVDTIATAAVINVNDAPTGAVTVIGTPIQGQTLNATNNIADIDGLGAISYQWRANGVVIGGATSTTLTLTQALVGKSISVTARYTDALGTAESVDSIATSAVANLNDVPTGSVAINGTATQGQTLTATNNIADADGLGTISYQWTANGVAIGGATASTLTLAQAQVGKSIGVMASYTDGWGTAESVSSTATAAVVNVNDAPTAGVFGNRIAAANAALSLNPGMLFNDIDSDTLSYGASGLPSGLAINSSTGQITGTTPNAAGVHHITVTGTDPGNASASIAFDLVVASGNLLTASVVNRGGLALPGVTAHELVSATPAGSLFSFKNITLDTNAATGIKTLTAELFADGSGEQSTGFSLQAAGGATLQGFQLTGSVTAANGWSITETLPSGGYTLSASHLTSSLGVATLVGKLTLTLPATALGSTILDFTSATLGGNPAPGRSLGYYQDNFDASGQLNATLPDGNVALSLSRSTADYLVNGTTKPVTAADALDALKLSVGLAASRGSSWKELISADINHDGRVTAADALEILKVSVGVNTIQPSWVFVPNDIGTNPNLATMSRTSVIYKDDLNLASITAPTSATITGIMVGDVNNSWVIPA